MEPIFVGWLSLLPPLLAISLALITKEVMSSLLIGILSGSLIYACASGLNPFMGTLTTTFDLMAKLVDMLMEADRYADVKKVTKDPEYRDKLMKEYKLVG